MAINKIKYYKNTVLKYLSNVHKSDNRHLRGLDLTAIPESSFPDLPLDTYLSVLINCESDSRFNL